MPTPEPEATHSIPALLLHADVRRLNAEGFARDCVDELRQLRRNFVVFTHHAQEIPKPLAELAEASIASIDRILMPKAVQFPKVEVR